MDKLIQKIITVAVMVDVVFRATKSAEAYFRRRKERIEKEGRVERQIGFELK